MRTRWPVLVLRDGAVLRGDAAVRRMVADSVVRDGPARPHKPKAERPTVAWRRKHGR